MAEVNLEEWSVKANDVMDIALFTKAEQGQTQVNKICQFPPTWTYPIVGEEETIIGYKGLKIHLRYNASDMRPHLSSTKIERLPEDLESGDLEVHEIHDLFEKFLPPCELLNPCPPHPSREQYQKLIRLQLPLDQRPTLSKQSSPLQMTGTHQEN